MIFPSSNDAIELFSKECTNSDCDREPSFKSSFKIENSWAICCVTSLGSGDLRCSAEALDSAEILSSKEVAARRIAPGLGGAVMLGESEVQVDDLVCDMVGLSAGEDD